MIDDLGLKQKLRVRLIHRNIINVFSNQVYVKMLTVDQQIKVYVIKIVFQYSLISEYRYGNEH